MRSEQRFNTTVKPFNSKVDEEMDNSLLIGDITDLGLADYGKMFDDFQED